MKKNKKETNWTRLIIIFCISALSIFSFAAIYPSNSKASRDLRQMRDSDDRVNDRIELIDLISDARKSLDRSVTESEKVIATRELNRLLSEYDQR